MPNREVGKNEPMLPPMAIICRCLSFKLIASAGSAGGWSGRGLPSRSVASVTTLAFGLRLKLSSVKAEKKPSWCFVTLPRRICDSLSKPLLGRRMGEGEEEDLSVFEAEVFSTSPGEVVTLCRWECKQENNELEVGGTSAEQ